MNFQSSKEATTGKSPKHAGDSLPVITTWPYLSGLDNPHPVYRKAACACGGNCPACKAESSGMDISKPGDAAEIEADQIADRIMRKPVGESTGSKDEIQPAANPGSALFSGGHSLDTASRDFFEPRLGYDLSNVRIHTDSAASASARAIEARAYTLGNDIVFGAGEYQPENQGGKHLLAHELAHVTQSTQGSGQIKRNTLYRTPTANGARELKGVPKEGIFLKTKPDHDPTHIFNAALVENGDKVVVKNDNVKQFITVKNGTWAWIEVPGKTSTQPDYPVMHGFIETGYLSEGAKPAAAPSQNSGPSQAVVKEKAADLSSLKDWELESEINAMRTWLSDHSDDQMNAKLALYEAEASQRVEKERETDEKNRALESDQPEEDITELEHALSVLKNGRYVSPVDQGASGASAEGPGDHAKNALNGVDEKFLVPATDAMEFDPVLRLEASINQLEARIAKQKNRVANWSTDAKLIKAIESGIRQVGGQLGERLKELLSPESLAIIAVFAVAYVISQTTPIGWVADILVAAMLAATILMVGNEAIEIVKLLIEFVEKAEGAKSQKDLDEAGKALAAAVTKAGVDIIVAILLHKAGKAANLKPPGPRSPGLIEVLKTTGETVKTTLTDPVNSGWQVAADGVTPWEANMSMMEGPPETSSGPKNSTGSGRGSGTVKGAGDPAADVGPKKPTQGQGLSSGGGLPKDPIIERIKGKKPPAEDPAASTPKDEATSDTPAKKGGASEGALPEPEVQRGVKSALERIETKIAEAKTEMAEASKEISKLSKEVFDLKQKLKDTPSSDPNRAKMLEEFQTKQKELQELNEQQAHRKALNDQNLDTRTRLKNALEAKTYARPSFSVPETVKMRAEIWDQAVKEGGGKVKSPSGAEIKPGDPWEMGHKPKYEFWKHVRSAAERGITREQFLRECKDTEKYRPETKADNSSHAFEDKTDAYLGE